MKSSIKLLLSSSLTILVAFSIAFGMSNLVVEAAPISQKDKLIERVAKDYTSKFCNGIGFGLSEKSAMDFAFKENKQSFKNKKGIEAIDNNLLSESISILVIEKCGYPLNLSGEKGIIEFKNKYLSMINNH